MTPFAIFGFPSVAKMEGLTRCLKFRRFSAKGLDALVVDLTRTGRSELPDDWEGRFSATLQALEHVTGRRPPVVVLCEDAFAPRRAVRTLRGVNAASRHVRRMPLEVGTYLQEPGLFGPTAILHDEAKIGRAHV